MIEHLVPVLAVAIAAATPLIFAGLGELVAERTGVSFPSGFPRRPNCALPSHVAE